MDNNTPKINITGSLPFPNQLDPFEVKKQEEWGKNLGNAIASEWFYKPNGGMCKYYTDRAQMIERRIYAKGLQSMDKYKKQLGTNGDLSFLNLSTKPLSIIPKLIDVVANGMANRDYSVRATAVDPISQDNKIAYRRQLETDMLAKDVLVKAKETFGIEAGSVPIDEVPETKDELDLHMQLEYKQSIELSEELAIQSVFEENKYADTTEGMLTKDVIILGVGWAKTRFVPSRGIVLDYVDPENKIQSYTEDPYFRDCSYHGEIKQVLISDVLVEYPWINTNEKAKAQLEHSGTNWFTYHSLKENDIVKGTTNLLYFTYKTTRTRAKKIKQKATGEKVLSDAAEVFDTTNVKSVDFKRVEFQEEILFEGVMVLGTDIVLKWEVSENMSRPKSNKQKVIDQYIGVAPNREKGYIDSLVARMIPIEDKLNMIELKADQIIQQIKPDGFFIDLDAIAELDLGDGKVMTSTQLFNMFCQTGSVFGRGYSAGGEYNSSKKPFEELRTGGSLDKLNALGQQHDRQINKMRDVIGLNSASDASTPDKDSLVGIQKLMALNSNVATRHILNARSYITKGIAEAVTYRIADLLKFSELKEDFIRKVGATAVMDLEYVKDLHLYDFGISLDLALDDEERAKLEADLSAEIQKGVITTEDKYRILAIKNLKLAIGYMTLLRKKREKKMEEAKKREFEYQSDQNIRAAQAAEEARQQTATLQGQVEMQVQNVVNQGLIQKEVVKGEQDRLSLEMKIIGEKEIAQLGSQVQFEKLNIQEDRKDERTAKQASQQSRMKEQAQNESGAIDFEAEETNADLFRLR